jgi:hypothetical protein
MFHALQKILIIWEYNLSNIINIASGYILESLNDGLKVIQL